MNPNTVVVLCNGWRRESEHAKVRVVAQRVTLPLCGEKSLDKERDTRGNKSDARVLDSGPAQAQPINGYFIASDHKGSLSPFYECCVSMSGANLTLPHDGHAVGTNQKSLLQPTFPFLSSQSFHV